MFDLLHLAIQLVELLLLIRIVLSWLQKENENSFTKWVCNLFEPVLLPIRKVLPTSGVGIDFSPILLFIVIDIVKRALVSVYF